MKTIFGPITLPFIPLTKKNSNENLDKNPNFFYKIQLKVSERLYSIKNNLVTISCQ